MGHTAGSYSYLQKAALVGLLSYFDCTSAFAPSANQLPLRTISRTQLPHFSLSQSRYDDNERAFSTPSAAALRRSVATISTSAALFATVLASPISIQLVRNGNMLPLVSHSTSQILSLPKTTVFIERSQAWAMTENQQLVADVWFAVTAQFFDPTFNGLGEDGWRGREREAISAVADSGPDDDEVVTRAISVMLSALNDPYTRYLPREKYEALTAYATGGNIGAGIGVQLLEDPRTQNVMVMATTRGGPADAAGVRSGDVILKVGGESVELTSAEVVAAKCRGEPGTKVDVQILHKSVDDPQNKKQQIESITLTRAKINPNPIEASTFVSAKGKTVGLLRVPSFSTNTVKDMVDGLRSITADNRDGRIDAIAVDIRGNVGGYMPAGVDAAKLFLPARAHIIAEVGRPGSPFKTYDAEGIGADTTVPLYLIVDRQTASAAEIFAASLQDNRRASVVGVTNTFGKGRIQNVQPLGEGGVAVTRARYITPRGRDIHGVGIAPDRVPGGRCGTNDSARACLADIVDEY